MEIVAMRHRGEQIHTKLSIHKATRRLRSLEIKVAQDTAYWDLKEKLQQVEGNHERLQQNMVEVQMQHEAISGQYQDELRLRPETLNKMTSTREICDVLEEYSERLKETLSRCKTDQATLCEAYQKSGQLVRDIKMKQLQADEHSKQLIERLEEKVKLTSEHQSQLLQYFTEAKKQTDSELADAKQKLSVALEQKDELLTSVNELRRKVDLDHHEIQKKEESISSLQKDMKQLLHEFNLQAADMKNTILKQEKDLKETAESNDALKKALRNQENFTKSICDQNSQLQEKISSLEDENISFNNTVKDLEAKLQALLTTNEENKQLMENLTGKKDELEKIIVDKDEALNSMEAEKQRLQQQAAAAHEQAQQAARAQAAREGQLRAAADLLQRDLDQLRKTTSQQISELAASEQLKDKELDTKAHTIAQLMTELKGATDARAKLELTLQRVRSDADLERDAASQRDSAHRNQIEQLEAAVRNKDDEISKQISIILEIRSEKDRLQDKIQSMQNTIDNIQKELTGRVAPSTNRHPPDQDDNAVMCPPSKELSQSPKLPVKFAVPRSQPSEPKQLDLFSLFSDGSMDGDTIDPSEVNRRFEALSRGERVAPLGSLGLGSLKRRAGVPAQRGGLKHKPAQHANDDPISLSQVRDDMRKDKTFFKTKRAEVKQRKIK